MQISEVAPGAVVSLTFSVVGARSGTEGSQTKRFPRGTELYVVKRNPKSVQCRLLTSEEHPEHWRFDLGTIVDPAPEAKAQ